MHDHLRNFEIARIDHTYAPMLIPLRKDNNVPPY